MGGLTTYYRTMELRPNEFSAHWGEDHDQVDESGFQLADHPSQRIEHEAWA